MDTDIFRNLREKASNSLLVDRYEIAKILNVCDSLNGEFVIITKRYKQNHSDEIMPSLCAIKLENNGLKFSNSKENLIELIEQNFGFKNAKKQSNDLLSSILYESFKHKISLKESRIDIYYNNKSIEDGFELLNQGFLLLRSSSANMLNASIDLSLFESKKIGTRYRNSIHETAISITAFIQENYKLSCKLFNIIDGDYNSDILIADNFYTLMTFGRPLYYWGEDCYILLFPFTNDRKSVKIEHIFKIESKESLSKYLVTNLTKAFNYYFNSYIPSLIINHISELQNRIIAIHNDNNTYIEEINLANKLHEFSEIAFGKIIDNTSAHSATLRLHDPFAKQLSLITEVPSIKTQKDYGTKSISLKDPESINVFTFKNCSSNSFVYLKNIVKHKGVISSYDRPLSKSELCFPLFFKQIIIGTINFESPIEDGFGLKLKQTTTMRNTIEEYKDDATFNFFYSIKKLIEEYAEVLFDSNDKLWLSKRIQIYQNIHELKALTEHKDVMISHREIIKNAIYDTQQISINSPTENLFESVCQFRNKFIKDIENQSDGVAKIFESRIFLHNSSNSEVEISREDFLFLEILFKNIFSNFYKNYDKFNDGEIIIIRLVKNMLFINIHFTFNNYSEHNLYRYLVRPFSDSENKRSKTHYGLFIIGMITRHLKGICHIKKPENNNKKSWILINIPFNKNK